MTRADGDELPTEHVRTAWLRFGVVAAVVSLLYTGLVFYLLQIDPVLGLVVAIVGSVVAGAVVMILALYRRDGETLVERWFGDGRDS